MNKDYKPWLEHPEIWATEAAFWSYLRGALRRGVWEKSAIKIIYKHSACEPPPEGYVGRAKSGTYCALTGEWESKSRLQVDHIKGNVSLLSWDDVLPFVMHLVPPKGSLQLVKSEAHKIKSYSERMGISFEEAVLEKKVIAFGNLPVGEQNDTLKSLEVFPLPTNAKTRKEAYRIHLKNIP